MSDLETSKINVWKESLDAASSSAIGFVLSLLYTILLVRVLPQTEVGLFFFYLAIVFLVIQITKGVGASVRKRVSSIDDNEERAEYLWVSILLIVPLISILLISLYIVSQVFSASIPLDITKTGILAVLFASLGTSVMELGRFHLSGSGEPGRAERYRVLVGKVSVVLLTGLVIFYPRAELVLVLRGIGYAISGILMLYLAPHTFVSPTKEKVIEILRFSKWSIPTHLLNDFYHRWDTILLGLMVGTVSISYYDSSVRLATIGFPLMLGISSAANVKLSGLYESDKDVKPVFEKLLVASTFCAYPALIVFFFSGEFLLELTYGADYVPAAMMLFLIAVQQVFQSFRFQFEALFNSFDIPKETTKTSGLSVLLNVITAPFLVLQFGALGVIYSTLLAEVLRLSLYEYQAYKKTNKVFINKAIILQPLILIFLGVLIQGLCIVLTFTSLQLFIVTLSSVPLFYGLLYYLSPQTKQIFLEARKQLL